MKLSISKSKNATLYYVQKSYRIDSGKSSTRTVERLGTIEEVKSRFGEENTLDAVKPDTSSRVARTQETVGGIFWGYSTTAVVE